MKNTIEKKVLETILDRPIVLTIGGKTFNAARPTVATVIEASEYMSELPAIKLSDEDVLTEVLAIAPDCRPLGKVAAALILGAEPNKQSSLFSKRRKSKKIDHLADFILCSLTPTEMMSVIKQLLDIKTVTDFFAVTTSLTEVNLLRRARKAEEVEK